MSIRTVVATVGPLATASATKISASQNAAISGTNYLVLNGAAGTAVAAAVCASQTPSGAGALTLNGSLASSVPTGVAVAYLGAMQRIYITGGSNESGRSFVVTGLGYAINGTPYAIKETITGPNASTVSSINTYYSITSITVDAATAGAITVGAYGTATLDIRRRVIITSGGNDTGVTFTITGTDTQGNPISEALVGASGAAAQSALDYLTVTSISASAAVATTVTVGTNTVASTWVRLAMAGANAAIAGQCTPSSAGANYTVEQTLDDCNAYPNTVTPAGMTWVSHPSSAVVAATTTQQFNYAYPPTWTRVTLNSGTGSVTMTVGQTTPQ